MLFALPFSTFDDVRARGLEVAVRCSRCWHNVTLDLADARLSTRSFCGGIRFRCTNVLKPWSEGPGKVCNAVGSLVVRPPKEESARLMGSGRHGYIVCPTCEPGWHIHVLARDEAPWREIFDHPRFTGLRCPTCRAKLKVAVHNSSTR